MPQTKRPAARTLGRDWEKSQRQDLGPEWRRALAPGKGRGGLGLRLEATPPCPGRGSGTRLPASPPLRTPRPPSYPSPRALADLAGAGALHSEARGGAGPPDTAALRHEPPLPARHPGPGRGAHFLYLAGLDPILSRGGLQSPPTPSHSHPWSRLRWRQVSPCRQLHFPLLSSRFLRARERLPAS